MKANRIVRIVLPAIVAMVLLYPYEHTVVPAANILVLDEGGKPFPNAAVKQEWIDATVEARQHVDFSKSNETGLVSFPRRTKRAPLGWRILKTGWAVLTAGHHGNVGSSGAITVYSNNPYKWVWSAIPRNGNEWPAQMRLERTETAIYP